MVLDNIPLFAMLKGRLGYLSQRERLVAENVANADTPGFTPRDLKPFSFQQHMAAQNGVRGMTVNASPQAAAAMSRMQNMPGVKRTNSYDAVKSPDSDTTLDGNQVVLEDQMLKMNETRMNYDAAITFYQKSMGILRLAARPPGR